VGNVLGNAHTAQIIAGMTSEGKERLPTAAMTTLFLAMGEGYHSDKPGMARAVVDDIDVKGTTSGVQAISDGIRAAANTLAATKAESASEGLRDWCEVMSHCFAAHPAIVHQAFAAGGACAGQAANPLSQ
jgi:hypothetical protein